MELLKPNYINTTTAIVVNSNTTTAEYMMNPDVTFQYVSSGLNDDNTNATIRINFSETLTVSRIGLLGINTKEMSLYHSGLTASAFTVLSGATTSSKWTANSETGLYLQVTPVACTSVSLDMKKTMVANMEKAIGYFVISQERLDFTRIPSAKNYNPMNAAEEVVHYLSDGNVRIQTIANRWSFDVRLEYISTALRDSLFSIYKLHAGHIFVPFGTTTAWDAIMVPVVWESPFNFFKHSDNAVGTGFEGSLKLRETTP